MENFYLQMSLSKNNNKIFEGAELKVVYITSDKCTASWNYDYVRVDELDLRNVHIDHSGPFLGTFIKMKWKKRLSALLCLSARMEQVGCHCTDFSKIWC